MVWIASENGLTKTVRLLLENGASVDYPDLGGSTALFYGKKILLLFLNTFLLIFIGCKYNANIDLVISLINASSDLNIKNSKGQTALMFGLY